jgi:hypothetical protein
MSEPESTLTQKTATGVAWISAFQVIQAVTATSIGFRARTLRPASGVWLGGNVGAADESS